MHGMLGGVLKIPYSTHGVRHAATIKKVGVNVYNPNSSKPGATRAETVLQLAFVGGADLKVADTR
ncbi:hypothetical protein SGFS_026820 [Streptomyces graminofaciens]|jgi:hypothetical protein|uniref:Uncharacterized protein n=1 Tax=Streptomyces graminofaciens TaxID=68212 RepID=A0ABM7F665_9ACTN|nr:hypothetical protein SGFS_026820 [Streptomyces graminofaciens]